MNPTKNNKLSKKPREISDSAISYGGPVIPPFFRSQRVTITTPLRFNTLITSSAGGVLNGVYGSQNPSSCSNWSSFAAVYDEYRVLATKLEFQPVNRYNKAIAITPAYPGYVVLDRDSTTALTSLGQAAGYESAKFVSLEGPFTHSYRMSSTAESTFITTAAPTNRGALLFFFTSLGNAQVYGNVQMTMLVQFRGTA